MEPHGTSMEPDGTLMESNETTIVTTCVDKTQTLCRRKGKSECGEQIVDLQTVCAFLHIALWAFSSTSSRCLLMENPKE